MKRKISFIILLIILIVVIFILVIMKNTSKKDTEPTEITPLSEITDEQERQTIVSLYFVNSETNKLVPEARKVDVKELLTTPYTKIVEFLIEGPKNETLKKAIPEGTKVNNSSLKKDVLELDLSKEFIENQKGDFEKTSLSIYSIVNTLTELNEINAVKILIDGKDNEKFKNCELNLEKTFIRKD